MTELHLSDDRLIELCVDGPIPPEDAAHLVICARCEAKRVSIVQILDELAEAAVMEADEVFPADRLDRQQDRIIHRIEQDGRPGRLIAFPAAPPAMPGRTRPHVRWAAAAAAAAFFIGMVAGHMVHDLPLTAPPAGGPQIVSNNAGAAPVRAISTTLSEDEFFRQIEEAARNGPTALQPLDAMTPRAWEPEER